VEVVKPRLFADDLNKDPLIPSSIELPIKDLFPWAKIESSLCDGYNDFTPHNSALQVCIRIVFRTIVVVLTVWLFWGQPFQPSFKVSMQTRFIVVDKDGGGDVHRVYQADSLLDSGG